MVLTKDFQKALVAEEVNIKRRVGKMGVVIHGSMACFTYLNNSAYISQSDIDDYCENKRTDHGIKDNLHKELSNIYETLMNTP